MAHGGCRRFEKVGSSSTLQNANRSRKQQLRQSENTKYQPIRYRTPFPDTIQKWDRVDKTLAITLGHGEITGKRPL
ncbi:hypothetical protein SAMN06265222_12066 [Neorhodopirellula lusitana]|uniref:Uncharacterized protein n=1 Tax=Neorhodopirellula lusitana TaxID=445327 RepID=A0ABY1QP40_9BACT|nr:hypothetical protein SAMN06265222_12066 [Neorhodopirellula lusitana]